MAEALRIAMVGPFGLSPKGTMRRRALPLAQALATRGHRVSLWMPPWHTPSEARRTWQEGDVTLHYVPLRPERPPLTYLATTLRLVRGALSDHPQVIHCFKPKAYSGWVEWLLWHIRRLGGPRVRLILDEDDWEGPGGWNTLEPYPLWLQKTFAWQERWGLRHADAITTASRTLQSLIWALGVPPQRVYYIPNGVWPLPQGDGERIRHRYGLGESPIILLYTRFFEYDAARALEVYARIRQALSAARLLVVGEALIAPEGERFRRLAHQAGLADGLIEAGWAALEDLPDYFAAADVAIFPFDDTLVNRAKCSGKLADLLAAGVPVVADAVGQNAEYIRHGETGLLVPSGHIEAMAQAALGLLSNRPWARTLGEQAAQRMHTEYHWGVLVERLLEAYYTA